ncbi:hypothetical protein KBC70_02615 [Candidatus Woesebacteria bacterium]|nr:hypothetical protein [Candidatus Woesebacteria bacterium]
MLTALSLETSFQTWHRGNLVAPRTYPDWTNPSTLKRYDSETEAEYAKRHLQQIGLLLVGAAKAKDKKEHSLASMSEALIVLALRKPLSQFGFDVQLAPEELEQGDYDLNDKGFDVTIARSENGTDVPFLVLNAKLRALKDGQRADGHCYSYRAKAPYVSCSLGNWKIDTRDAQEVDYRTWAEEYVIPHIKKGGGIPHIPEFQNGVIEALSTTVNHYQHRVNRIKTGSYILSDAARSLLPDDPAEHESFEYKLRTMAETLERLKLV